MTRVGRILAKAILQWASPPPDEKWKIMDRSEFELRLRWSCMNRGLHYW